MDIRIGNDWDEVLKDEFKKDYMVELNRFLEDEYSNYEIFPEKKDVFNALKITSYKDVKVVILGQDPYHGKGQANGLSFSVNDEIDLPPSLKNIFKEINLELGIDNEKNGNLEKWARQGVLLLNTVLTVRAGQPNSHRNKGWEILTDTIIKKLNERDEKIVFMLWGKPSEKKSSLIGKKHVVLKSSHPSPLSAYRGFLGCGHFKEANKIIREEYGIELDWDLRAKTI